MKISFVISSLSHGGSERTVSEMANYLCSRGHEICIVTFPESLEKPFYPLKKEIKLVALNYSSDFQKGLFKKILKSFRRIFAIRKSLSSSKPDIIVSFIDTTNVTVLLAKLGLRLPLIVAEQSDPNFHKIPKLYHILRIILYPLSSQMVCVSNSAFQYFPKWIRKKSQIIPSPNRITVASKMVIRKQPISIMNVGRLGEEKDQKTLIRAIPLVLKRFPNIILFIYGEGVLREKLQNLINSLKIQDHVNLMGTKSNLEAHIKKGDLFVFPSIYEGCPLALLEAMALGLPCVVSDCNGNREIIDDGVNGSLFPTGDHKKLSEKINNLLSNRQMRINYSQSAQQKAKRYDANIIFSLWEKLLEETTNY